MVPDGQKVLTDGMNERMDQAKTISRIKHEHS